MDHLKLEFIFSTQPHSSLHISYGKENLLDNQEFLTLLIISFILTTFTFDSRLYGKEKLEASHWGLRG